MASDKPHPTLGNVIEICIATKNAQATIEELKTAGIGPWQIYEFDTDKNVTNATIAGQSGNFRLTVGFAQLTSEIVYEVIEPHRYNDTDDGTQDIFNSWLNARNGLSGIHHIAYDLGNIPWEDRLDKFQQLGYKFVQGGTWLGKKGTCQFAWFQPGSSDELGKTSTYFETIKFSDDWEEPEPDRTL